VLRRSWLRFMPLTGTPLTYLRHWLTYAPPLAAAAAGHPGAEDLATRGVSMDGAAFEQLLARVRVNGAPAGARNVRSSAVSIRELRSWTELSQPDFTALPGVELTTLRNWEQGRRGPTGPAPALLRALRNDPEHVIRALGRSAARVRPRRLRVEVPA
jgi:putative transcriptional regulator